MVKEGRRVLVWKVILPVSWKDENVLYKPQNVLKRRTDASFRNTDRSLLSFPWLLFPGNISVQAFCDFRELLERKNAWRVVKLTYLSVQSSVFLYRKESERAPSGESWCALRIEFLSLHFPYRELRPLTSSSLFYYTAYIAVTHMCYFILVVGGPRHPCRVNPKYLIEINWKKLPKR